MTTKKKSQTKAQETHIDVETHVCILKNLTKTQNIKP